MQGEGAGGRWIARERQEITKAEREERVDSPPPRPRRATEPLVRCLRAESLAALADFCEVNVRDLIERYS